MKKNEYIDDELRAGNSTDGISEEPKSDVSTESLGYTEPENDDIEVSEATDGANPEDADINTLEAAPDNSGAEDVNGSSNFDNADAAPLRENVSKDESAVYQDPDTLPLFGDESVYMETDLFGEEHPVTEDRLPENTKADEESGDGESEDDDGAEVSDEQTEDSSPLPQDGDAEATQDQPEEKPRRVDSLFDFIELFVFTLAAVFIITSFFFRYSIVDGGSMQNTLEDKESLILRSIFYTPESGDVIVVQDKSTILKDPIVKRVIATEGQTVKFTRDAVYVDGVKLDEPYVYTGDYKNPFGGEDVYRYSVYPSDALLPIVTDREDGVFYEITIPDGEIFVMGDHRNNSRDSRDIGTLHEDAVIGKVVLRFLPFSKFGKIE